MEASKYDEARKALQPLLASAPDNPWYLDLATDIDLGQKKSDRCDQSSERGERHSQQSGIAA